MNITLDNTSSQFIWGNWRQDTNSWSSKTGDSRYYDGTFHTTSGVDDELDITFQGTAIYLYGAKHGDAAGYTAFRIDGGNPQHYAEPPIDVVQQVLVAVTGLDPNESHKLNWAANVGSRGTTFDIDYVVITPNVGAVPSSSAGTLTTSATSNGVSIPSSPSTSAPLSASLPSSHSSMPSSSSSTSFAQASAGSSAGSAPSNSATSPAGSDGTQGNAQESGAPRLGPGSVDTANTASSTGDNTSSKSNTGAIAGGVAGGVVALAIVAFSLWWFLCRRKRQSEQRVDPLVEGKPLDLAEGGSSAHWALPTYAQSQGANNIAESVYYTSPTTGPGESRSFSAASDHTFLSPTAPPASYASYPYSVYPPSTVAPSEVGSDTYRSPFWSGLSPPATPSSRQGAASRAASVPESATSRYSHLQRSEKSPTSLPYRNSGQSTPATTVPSNAGSASTNQSYKHLYQKWNERNMEAGSLKE